jgi:hypothetical protein
VKVFWILLYVDVEWDEVLVDERRDVRIGVGLGFQPSTRSSGGRRAEVDEQRFGLFLCFGKRLVGVFDPIYGHSFIPPCLFNYIGMKPQRLYYIYAKVILRRWISFLT